MPHSTPTAAAVQPEVLLLTGMSGAGRSTAANALEDLGWFVVDNMPPSLLPRMVELARQARPTTSEVEGLRIAAVADVRGGDFFGDLTAALVEVRQSGIHPRLLFLEADDATLVRRFEASRRPHPLQGGERVIDGIAAERQLLASLREDADLLIDTSDLNVHQLRGRVEDALGQGTTRPLHVTVLSFGFKYGLPVDADFVGDCRFLPNPHWEPELRPQTGQDPDVAAYVLGQPAAEPFLQAFERAVQVALSGYRTENKPYATIALGCTGGKHRSVAMAAELAARLASDDVDVRLVHRDVGRE